MMDNQDKDSEYIFNIGTRPCAASLEIGDDHIDVCFSLVVEAEECVFTGDDISACLTDADQVKFSLLDSPERRKTLHGVDRSLCRFQFGFFKFASLQETGRPRFLNLKCLEDEYLLDLENLDLLSSNIIEDIQPELVE